jgi:hypothetical protein
MNLVSFALRRPITILVLVIAVMMTGLLAIERMPRDVFPNLGVPILYVAQPYGGLDPAQMEGFIVNYFEYHFLYITGIEHVESKSIQGVGLVKLQFQPGTDMAGATAETVSYVNRARAFMPSGTVPPFVLRFDAGSVPVGDLVFSDESGKLGVKELQDAALFRVRPLFATLPGVSAPPPFGGSPRTRRDQRRSRPAARLQHEPGRDRPGHREGQHDHSVRQRAYRQRDTNCSGELGGNGRNASGRGPDPLRRDPHDLRPRYRNDCRLCRYRSWLRARQWPPHGLHSGH